MKISRILIAGGAMALIGASAAAQTVGLGTTKGGLTAQVTATLSKVCATRARIPSRGGFCTDSRRFDLLADRRFRWATGGTEAR